MKWEFFNNLKRISTQIKDKPTENLSKIIDNYKSYFGNNLHSFEIEKINMDECLYKDYSRNDYNRILDCNKIKNPFSISKFSNNIKDKVWYTKNNNVIEGPFDSIFMDELFELGKLKNNDLIGLNSLEFFTLNQFLSIIYPIPKNKNIGEIKPKSIKISSKVESTSSIFNDDSNSISINDSGSNKKKEYITPKMNKFQKMNMEKNHNSQNEYYKKTFSATQMKSFTYKKNFSKKKNTEIKTKPINEEFVIVKKFQIKKRDYHEKAKIEENKVKKIDPINYEYKKDFQKFGGAIDEIKGDDDDISFEIN